MLPSMIIDVKFTKEIVSPRDHCHEEEALGHEFDNN